MACNYFPPFPLLGSASCVYQNVNGSVITGWMFVPKKCQSLLAATHTYEGGGGITIEQKGIDGPIDRKCSAN